MKKQLFSFEGLYASAVDFGPKWSPVAWLSKQLSINIIHSLPINRAVNLSLFTIAKYKKIAKIHSLSSQKRTCGFFNNFAYFNANNYFIIIVE